jgi:phenylacetate-CoA ligase
MDVDSVITEFLNKDGQAVSANKKGEVAYTSLFNYAMPFIRYAIGDIAVPSSDDACSCGRTLPLMKIVEGRKDSFLTLPGNRIVSPMVFNYAFSTFELYRYIDQFQIHQKSLEDIDVYLKINQPTVDKERLAKLFNDHMKSLFELDNVHLNLTITDEIPLSKTGKLRSVWSDIPRGEFADES